MAMAKVPCVTATCVAADSHFSFIFHSFIPLICTVLSLFMNDEALPPKQILIEESFLKLACRRTAFAASNLMHEDYWCDSVAVHLQKSNSQDRLPAHAM